MKATDVEVARLLESHGIDPVAIGGNDTLLASRGGRVGSVVVAPRDSGDVMVVTVEGKSAQGVPPQTQAEALALVATLRGEGAIAGDTSSEHMLADLLVKTAKLYHDTDATLLEFRDLHLHPTAYHIGAVTLLHDKPLHTKARLESDSTKSPR
jgi:hypothetical protein